MPNTRYVLLPDDDGHWYVIPVDKQDEFFKWVENTMNACEDLEMEFPDKPDWADLVPGAPNLVEFGEYVIK